MRVIHFLKDGSRINDITGHIVRLEDARTLYSMIERLNDKAETIKSQMSQKQEVCKHEYSRT